MECIPAIARQAVDRPKTGHVPGKGLGFFAAWQILAYTLERCNGARTAGLCQTNCLARPASLQAQADRIGLSMVR
jgi:hypothetical protein